MIIINAKPPPMPTTPTTVRQAAIIDIFLSRSISMTISNIGYLFFKF